MARGLVRNETNGGFLVNTLGIHYPADMVRTVARMTVAVLAVALMTALLGCGAAAMESGVEEAATSARAVPASAPGITPIPTTAQSADSAKIRGKEVSVSRESMAEAMAGPESAFAEAMAEPKVPFMEDEESAMVAPPTAMPTAAEAPHPPGDGQANNQPSVAAQERIIIRTVSMGLLVDDVGGSVDMVGGVAQELGGWVVTSDHSNVRWGSVSARIPAQQLDEAIRRIRNLAVTVNWENSTSQDVTDEYVDSSSRLRSLRATEEALLQLMSQAKDVEDALAVQRELTHLQSDIESLEGRIKFLEQSSAYSLIHVEFTLAPQELTVDAGPDQTLSVGHPARFRATFTPPEDIEDFHFTWDFGDGTRAEGTGSAPTTVPGERVTATITHQYFDDRDSPYIVEIELTGTGPAGVVEGTDTLIATVTRLPTIEVFAGESLTVEEGQAVEFNGSFTRGEGLSDLQYRWEFGDGSPAVTGAPAENDTRVTASHTFENYRPQPYEVTLTITAQSEAGEVESSSSVWAQVTESQGLIVGNWNLGESAKWAVRGLSVIALGVVNVVIWALVFSPVWLVLVALVYVFIRWRRRRRARRAGGLGGPEHSPLVTPEA